MVGESFFFETRVFDGIDVVEISGPVEDAILDMNFSLNIDGIHHNLVRYVSSPLPFSR